MRCFFGFLLLCFSICAQAQVEDTVETSQINVEGIDTVVRDTGHSPRKAAILSAILPGTGQFYNKKYWKMPIVYAAIGTSVYFIIDNRRTYLDFRQAALDRIENGDSIHINTIYENFSQEGLITQTERFRRFRDLSFAVTTLFYVLNIVDASVDAHLMNFDTDDFELSWRPSLLPSNTTTYRPRVGLSLLLKF